MIKMSVELPEIWDTKDSESMKKWMVSVKQSIEELARKAVSSQEETRTSAPNSTMIEEGEQVKAVIGGNSYIYTKVDGVVKTWLLA